VEKQASHKHSLPLFLLSPRHTRPIIAAGMLSNMQRPQNLISACLEVSVSEVASG